MNIHEYQAKELLRRRGLPVPDGRLVQRGEEIKSACSALDGPKWMVKAQIHAGGRGKGHFAEFDAGDRGGVRLTRSVGEATMEAGRMLGRTLITEQTGPEGCAVGRLYIEEGADIADEVYLALLIDQSTGWPCFLCSHDGGMDIEDVAVTNPDSISRILVDPAMGFQAHHGRRIALALGLPPSLMRPCVELARRLMLLFLDKDLTMVEINPLCVTSKKKLLCLDARMSFDENALYRNPDIVALRDESQIDPRERSAGQHHLSFVGLEGSIGCLVNGAGLAMATMDMIALHGAKPANFLDVGGNASREQVTEAFRLITADSNVRAILVNIFGGIMRCDLLAEGIVAAVQSTQLDVPLVVRLEGTDWLEGQQILQNAGLDLSLVEVLDAAAKAVVAAAAS